MNSFELEEYLRNLMLEEEEFKNKNNAVSSNKSGAKKNGFIGYFKQFIFFLRSLSDFLRLISLVVFCKKNVENKRIVFTAKNFSVNVNGQLEDRIVKPLFSENVLFINHSKEYGIRSLNGQKVYNIGGVVWLCSNLLYRNQSEQMKLFLAHKLINDSFVRFLNGNEVFTLCYYDLNGMSLVFSNFRHRFKLVEIQHGSIVNYPPYVKPAPVKIADTFYVKNQPTIDYLKSHLCRDFPAEYKLIPYPKGNRQFVAGTHILYASTVEFNGLHPVFSSFLSNHGIDNLHVVVRLHPRERDKEGLFASQLEKFGVNYEFDRSKNWLEGNSIENLIVVSPWSSSIEDSYDNGFVTIIIDPVGKQRFQHLIDGKRCFYSDNLVELFHRSDFKN